MPSKSDGELRAPQEAERDVTVRSSSVALAKEDS